jgi:uncharacterized protein YcbX
MSTPVNVPELVGSVTELWRFPVKSMQGECVDALDVTPAGIAGDRAYGIIDVETGKVVSAKHPRRWPELLHCRAVFTAEPAPGAPPPPARIELADGTEVTTDAPDVDAVLSRFFGRDVHLTMAAPKNYTIAEYHPDLANLNPQGDRDVVVEQVLGSAFFNAIGMPSAVPEGSLVDLFPISVLTTSTLRHFSELQPDSQWDLRRFRMNVIIQTPRRGLAEDAWAGNLMLIGGAVLIAAIPTPRCVMANLAQEDLPRDSEILKTIARHNQRDVAGAGNYPCLGIYAIPGQPGTVRAGDEVRLAPADFSLTVPPALVTT